MSLLNEFQVTFVTLAMLAILKSVECETYAECENVEDKIFTASTESCSGYIYCNGDESFQGQCDDGSYFNDEEKVCDDMELVDCHIEDENVDNTNTIPTTTSTTITTTTTILPIITTSVVDTTNVNNSTAATLISTTNVVANLTTMPTTTTASAIIIFTECPTVDNPFQIIFLASSKSCSTYFICINGTPIEMFCSGMLHFNAATGKCDYPENVGCLPDYSKPKEQCHRNVVDFFPHTSNCNYFYLCQNGFLMLQQCPLFFGWDMEKRNCVAINKAKCYA